MLTQNQLKELLHYDPETGVFTWRVSRGGAQAGRVAGTLLTCGYIKVVLNHREYMAHRLVFLYMRGALPENEVDHMNGVRDDNRWVNLRNAEHQHNAHNIGGAPSHNTSGFLGVSWHKATGKWRADIKLNNIPRFLGLFHTPEAAHAAYLKAKNELHPTHLRLREAA